jgi:hypothetical protein
LLYVLFAVRGTFEIDATLRAFVTSCAFVVTNWCLRIVVVGAGQLNRLKTRVPV